MNYRIRHWTRLDAGLTRSNPESGTAHSSWVTRLGSCSRKTGPWTVCIGQALGKRIRFLECGEPRMLQSHRDSRAIADQKAVFAAPIGAIGDHVGTSRRCAENPTEECRAMLAGVSGPAQTSRRTAKWPSSAGSNPLLGTAVRRCLVRARAARVANRSEDDETAHRCSVRRRFSIRSPIRRVVGSVLIGHDCPKRGTKLP